MGVFSLLVELHGHDKVINLYFEIVEALKHLDGHAFGKVKFKLTLDYEETAWESNCLDCESSHKIVDH